ncbi:MAG: hypothetical protein HGB20_08070 [Chlorobiaceae bacterium]|nr:hypothetical protein [Chlorobiaceae bacterium]
MSTKVLQGNFCSGRKHADFPFFHAFARFSPGMSWSLLAFAVRSSFFVFAPRIVPVTFHTEQGQGLDKVNISRERIFSSEGKWRIKDWA